MYNFLTMLDNFHETIRVLKLLPTCCIVFKRNAGIIHINDAAADFLKIESIEEHKIRKLKLESDPQFTHIIQNLIGKTNCIEKFKLKCEDNKYVIVNLNVSSFHKFKEVFILQFDEREPKELFESSHMLSESIQCDILMIKLRMKELANVHEKKNNLQSN